MVLVWKDLRGWVPQDQAVVAQLPTSLDFEDVFISVFFSIVLFSFYFTVIFIFWRCFFRDLLVYFPVWVCFHLMEEFERREGNRFEVSHDGAAHCPHFSSQDLHVSQGSMDSSVDMDSLNSNVPEAGQQTHQVLQVRFFGKIQIRTSLIQPWSSVIYQRCYKSVTNTVVLTFTDFYIFGDSMSPR